MSRRPRVVVTRPSQSDDSLVDRLKERGCEIVLAPTIEIGPPRSYEALDQLVRNPSTFDWILFMSRHAVRYFARRQRRYRMPASTPTTTVRLAAVGTATAATARRAGLAVSLESDGRTGADLAALVAAHVEQGSSLAIVQAEDGHGEAEDVLRGVGIAVQSVPAYRTRPASVPIATARSVRDAMVEALVFASPSSVVSFAIALGGLRNVPASVCVGVIGPTTADSCRRAGREPDVIAPKSSGLALADAILGVLDVPSVDRA